MGRTNQEMRKKGPCHTWRVLPNTAVASTPGKIFLKPCVCIIQAGPSSFSCSVNALYLFHPHHLYIAVAICNVNVIRLFLSPRCSLKANTEEEKEGTEKFHVY